MKLKLLVALLLTIEGFGKTKSVSVPVYGDTTGRYKMRRDMIAHMKMRDPLVSKNSFLLRVSSENWAVEIHTRDFKSFSGKQYFFTRQIVRDGEVLSPTPESELLFKTKPIKKPQARAVYDAFTKRSIISIPDERDIQRWGLTSDGLSYLFEYATPASYTLKSYSNPSGARYNVKEAATVDDFIREIETTLKLPVSFLTFLDKLPPGTYHTGGITAYTNTEYGRKAPK
jgi:hypothetical protein